MLDTHSNGFVKECLYSIKIQCNAGIQGQHDKVWGDFIIDSGTSVASRNKI